MKQLTYLIGLISAMSLSAGWVFSLMHWPGASQLAIYGFLGFAFLFMPLFAFDYSKIEIQPTLQKKLKLGLGVASILIVALSIVFKLLQLQGAEIILILGAGLFVFGFLPFLFFGMYKKSVS